jgi:hypothetical protein
MVNYKQEIEKLKERKKELTQCPHSNHQLLIYGSGQLQCAKQGCSGYRKIYSLPVLDIEENKAKLQTWKQALTSEIEFLEENVLLPLQIRNKNEYSTFEDDYEGWLKEIKQRIAELKGALE